MKSFAVAAASLILACSAESGNPRTNSEGGSPNAGGMINAGGSPHGGSPNGGNPSTGGYSAGGMSGGFPAMGGSPFSLGGASGGVTAANGGNPSGGNTSTNGGSTGGKTSAMGGATGGKTSGTGGASGGKASSGGATGSGTGGATSTAGAPALDCNATMPTDGTKHTGQGQGGKDNLAWQLWANNANNGSITTFSTPAFSAEWNNAGDYLARIGYEWGNAAKTYDAYGTITAQFAYKKTGTGGGYSYIGIYGWSNNPCVEWYIIDDSFNGMPVNPGNTTNKGTVTIDGGDYILYTRNTSGTGGSRCNGVSNWIQYYSVRKTARQCGTISITQHFDAWKAASMTLGSLLEAKILVEVGGGSGSVDFPVANVSLAK